MADTSKTKQQSVFASYYQLAKPGIIYGNVMTAAAGFLLAADWHIHFMLLFGTLLGTALIIGSACVYNNYIDRGIDQHMARTKMRALVSGRITGRSAIMYASVLLLAGFTVLAIWSTWLVMAIGAVAFIDYVFLYGFTKRHWPLGTIVGSIAGAAPVVAGYCAARGHVDVGALLVFLLLTMWQMPHFYAIAMYRYDDYKAAGLPVLPVQYGMGRAKISIILYIVAFTLAVSALWAFGYVGYGFLIVMTLLGLTWLGLGLQGFKTTNDVAWARQMFFFSLIVILGTSIMLSVGQVLI